MHCVNRIKLISSFREYFIKHIVFISIKWYYIEKIETETKVE